MVPTGKQGPFHPAPPRSTYRDVHKKTGSLTKVKSHLFAKLAWVNLFRLKG